MNYLILYLIKSSICLGVFLILYRAFLHNSTLFLFNRWVILTGTMVCFLLPLAKMETENNMLQYPMRYLESVLNIENSLTGKTINIRLSDSEDNNSFLTAGDNKVISGNQQSKVGFLNISYAAFIIMFLFVIYEIGRAHV